MFTFDPNHGGTTELVEQMLAAKKQLAGAQSDKDKDLYTNRCDGLDREKAAIGIMISLQPATGPMETEAASAGFYEHKTNQQKYLRLQLRTVKELMEGKGIERPSTIAATDETFKKAPESKKKHGEQPALGL
jgi:hypothetical protein